MGNAEHVGPCAETPAIDPDDRVHVRLEPEARAAGLARQVVRTTLQRWRLMDLADSMALAASELVSNALLHGRPPLSVTLRRRPRDVRLDVHDGSPVEPALDPGVAAEDATSGRGLQIVAALAASVGCEQIPNDGKRIYATFTRPQ
ncbi:MAG: ATP-binding protein [Mycobacteriales bacterium]